MIHVLKPPAPLSVADQLYDILRTHGARTVLLALAQALVRQRRESLAGITGVPPNLRRDVGLPPEPPDLAQWYRHI
ncbi:MAG: hypothetical protein AAGB05_08605 [Pseudomonadota bacterium]